MHCGLRKLLPAIAVIFSIQATAELLDYEFSQLLLYYKNRLDTALSGAEKYACGFQKNPAEERYKLFIDKARLKNPRPAEKNLPPHLIFDYLEPGYYQSMMDVFTDFPNIVGAKVDVDFLVRLHDQAVGKVAALKKGFKPGLFLYIMPRHVVAENLGHVELIRSGILFEGDTFLSLWQAGALSPQRIDRMLYANTQILNTLHNSGAHFLSHHVLRNHIQGIALPDDEVKNRVESIINHYYASVAKSTNYRETITAITELLRALEVIHFLPDGNTRTYAFSLLPKLLIENGLPPAILENPSMFRNFSTLASMALQLEQGIRNFLNEYEDEHRALLNQSDERAPASWVEQENRYQPFFTKYLLNDLMQTARASIKKAIRNAIDNDRLLNDKIEELGMTPLGLALFLDSRELVEELIRKGVVLNTGLPIPDLSFVWQFGRQRIGLVERVLIDMSDKDLLCANVHLLQRAWHVALGLRLSGIAVMAAHERIPHRSSSIVPTNEELVIAKGLIEKLRPVVRASYGGECEMLLPIPVPKDQASNFINLLLDDNLTKKNLRECFACFLSGL